MFTGIIEETGRVESIKPAADAIALTVRARLCARGLKIGDSLAINGCCLTVEKISPKGRDKLIKFSLLKETWNVTSLHQTTVGALVNLERALRAGDRFGGHFVTGHVDITGKISRWEKSGKDFVLDIGVPSKFLRYVVAKGSIAVDGISLTVAAVRAKSFRCWIIPHTRKVTALQERRAGDQVNLEADLLGKYAERFLTAKK